MPSPLDTLTVQDLYSLESIGVTLEDLSALEDLEPDTYPPAKIFHAIAWIAGRVTNPNLTLDEVRKQPLSQIMTLTEEDLAGETVPNVSPMILPYSL